MRLLLVEDDAELAAQLKQALGQAGFAVDAVAHGTDAEFRGQTEDYDAVVLDLGLPGMDGLSVLRRWRDERRSTPVLILTARDRWHDKLAAFNAGADDYVTKPFHTEELVLRLRALIRRSVGHGSPVLSCGALSLDANAARFPREIRPLADEHNAWLAHHERMAARARGSTRRCVSMAAARTSRTCLATCSTTPVNGHAAVPASVPV